MKKHMLLLLLSVPCAALAMSPSRSGFSGLAVQGSFGSLPSASGSAASFPTDEEIFRGLADIGEGDGYNFTAFLSAPEPTFSVTSAGQLPHVPSVSQQPAPQSREEVIFGLLEREKTILGMLNRMNARSVTNNLMIEAVTTEMLRTNEILQALNAKIERVETMNTELMRMNGVLLQQNDGILNRLEFFLKD